MVRSAWLRFVIAFAFVLALEVAGVVGLHTSDSGVPSLATVVAILRASQSLPLLVLMAAGAGAINVLVPLEARRSKRAIAVGVLLVFAILAVTFAAGLRVK